MVSLTFEHSYMREQLRTRIKHAAILEAAADAIEALNIDVLEVEYLRERISELEKEIDMLERNIRDAAGRLELQKYGHPDPGPHAYPIIGDEP